MFSHTTTCVQEPGSLIVLPPSCAYQYFSPQSSILWASFDSLSPQLEAFSAAVERQPVSAQPLSYQQQNDLLGGMMHRSNLTPPHASAALHDSQTLSSSGDYRDSRRNSRDSYSRDRPVVDSKELAEYKRDHHEKNTAAYRGGKPDSDRLDQNRSRSPEKGRGGDKDRRDDRDGRRDRSPDRKSDRRSRERSPDRRDKDRESSGSSKRSSHDDRRDDRDGKSDSYRRSDDRDRHRDRDDRDKERDRRRSSERDSHRDQDRDRHRERDRSRDRDDRNKRSTEQDKHHRSRHDDAADRSRSRGESGGSDRKRDKSRDRGTDRGRSRDRDSRSDLDRSGERVGDRDRSHRSDRSPSRRSSDAPQHRSHTPETTKRRSRSRSRSNERQRSDSRGRSAARSSQRNRDGSTSSVEYSSNADPIAAEPRTPTYQGPPASSVAPQSAEFKQPSPSAPAKVVADIQPPSLSVAQNVEVSDILSAVIPNMFPGVNDRITRETTSTPELSEVVLVPPQLNPSQPEKVTRQSSASFAPRQADSKSVEPAPFDLVSFTPPPMSAYLAGRHLSDLSPQTVETKQEPSPPKADEPAAKVPTPTKASAKKAKAASKSSTKQLGQLADEEPTTPKAAKKAAASAAAKESSPAAPAAKQKAKKAASKSKLDESPVPKASTESQPEPNKASEKQKKEPTPPKASAKKAESEATASSPVEKKLTAKAKKAAAKKLEETAKLEAAKILPAQIAPTPDPVPKKGAQKRKTEVESSSENEDAMDIDDSVSDADSKMSLQSSASSRFSLTILGAKHAIAAPPPYIPPVVSIFDQFSYPSNPVSTPRFDDEEIDAPPAKRHKLAESISLGPIVSVMPISEAPFKVGPFSLFTLLRATLLEAQSLGLSGETLKQIAAAQPRLHRSIPTSLNMANLIHLSMSFLAKDPIFQKCWVSCTPAPAGLPHDETLWTWAAHPPVFRGKQFGGSVEDEHQLFVLETLFWYCISRGLYSIDEANRTFVVSHGDIPVAPKAYSDVQRNQFRNQERKRFAKPKKPFEYSITDYPVVSVPRLEKESSAEKSALLTPEAPAEVPLRAFVVDALARAPGGVGTVEDVTERMLDSQFFAQDVDKSTLPQTVSAVLTQLSGLVDSPVKHCSEHNLWIYRYRERLIDDLKTEKTPAAPEKLVPHLFTSTSIARNIFWNPSGARRSNFSFLPPRRKIGESRLQEQIFRLIRNWNRTAEDVNNSALRRRGPESAPSSPVKSDSGKKKKKLKRDDPIPKHLRYFGEKRGSTSPTKRPGQTDREFLKEQQRLAKERQRQMRGETSDAMDVSDLQFPSLLPVAASSVTDESMIVDPISLNTDAPVVQAPESAATQAVANVAEKPVSVPTTKNSVFFDGYPQRLVVRSSDTDPHFLPETSRVPFEIEEMRQEWPTAAFGAENNVDDLLARCDFVLSAYTSAAAQSGGLFQRSSARAAMKIEQSNAKSTSPAHYPKDEMLVTPDQELSTARAPLELFDIESYPDLEWFHQDNPLTSSPDSDISVLRLVDLPSCVGYLHWLANLDEAVEEYLMHRDWRVEPGSGGRNSRISTDPQHVKDAMAFADPMRTHERISSSILPCNSFEAHHVRRRWNLFDSPPFSKILVPLPHRVTEFSRQRLPQGLWIPSELDFIYSVPPAEEGEDEITSARKRKRDIEIKSEGSSSSKKKIPKKLMMLSSSSSEDGESGDESDFENKKQKKKPAMGKKRKRSQDSDSESNPYLQNFANPTKPTTKSRRGQALVEGPDSAPDSCCRVVLARFAGKPLWPACIQTRASLKLKGFHPYGGGEYLWPFSCGSHFENTHIFTKFDSIGSHRSRSDGSLSSTHSFYSCADYYVDHSKLQQLLDGKMDDEHVFRAHDSEKARAFLKENRKLWEAAIKTAQAFLESHHILLDAQAHLEENASRVGMYPRQIPGVPQIAPEGADAPNEEEPKQTKAKSPKPPAQKKRKVDAPPQKGGPN
jgi:hypothetical protein